ncbi:MAG TPA: Nif3-like dinuclear metal center hexameric protein, partial [Lachnospiraceae bacterium]|nr:Nif3-like dinuclear metal center hexameric protein [Lachnospiraceae bacterium]
MKCYEVMERLEELSPKMYAEDWDNVGLLVGRREKEVRKIYIALDATDEVIEEAVLAQADMLLTHHPLIFSPIKNLSSEDFVGRRVLRLARHDIAYYAMHTNFDIMGMADAAADEIGLRKAQVLDITYEDDIAKEGIGRYGKLPSIMTLRECAEHVKRCFHIDKVKVFGDLDTSIETAAISPG